MGELNRPSFKEVTFRQLSGNPKLCREILDGAASIVCSTTNDDGVEITIKIVTARAAALAAAGGPVTR